MTKKFVTKKIFRKKSKTEFFSKNFHFKKHPKGLPQNPSKRTEILQSTKKRLFLFEGFDQKILSPKKFSPKNPKLKKNFLVFIFGSF